MAAAAASSSSMVGADDSFADDDPRDAPTTAAPAQPISALTPDVAAAAAPPAPKVPPAAAASATTTSQLAAVASNGARAATTQQQQQQRAAAAPPAQGIWDSILNSVKGDRNVPVKNIALLGQPRTGKSTLLQAIASSSPSSSILLPASTSASSNLADLAAAAPAAATTANDTGATTSGAANKATKSGGGGGSVVEDLGLGYAYFDVGDEEDVVARIGVYQVPSTHPTHLALLPFAFAAESVPDARQDAEASRGGTVSNSSSSQPGAAGQAEARRADGGAAGTRLGGKTSTGAAAAAAGVATTDSSSRYGHASVYSLRHTAVVITLDWEQPWSFLEQLVEWLDVLASLVRELEASPTAELDSGEAQPPEPKTTATAAAAAGAQQQRWTRAGQMMSELRERLELYVRNYVEPAAAGSLASGEAALGGAADAAHPDRGDGGATSPSLARPSSSAAAPSSAIVAVTDPHLDGEALMPLPEGTLTHNLGIPIVVVCTKADAIAKLERERDFKEEQFDYIQQVLRIICLKYGAALFYTSHARPQSFDIVRQYLLHRLFSGGAATSGDGGASGGGVAGAGGAAASTSFPFSHRASTVERDVLLVPSGWDSWGKVRALREGFDCAATSAGWEWDAAVERARRRRGLAKGSAEAEAEAERESAAMAGSGVEKASSAIKLYEDIVSDWEATPPSHQNAGKVKQPDEEAFLAHHYATLQKDSDIRGKFGRMASRGGAGGTAAGGAGATNSTSAAADGSASTLSGRNVVGPMASASSALPRLERAMQMSQQQADSTGASTLGGGFEDGGGGAKPSRVGGGAARRDSARDASAGLTSSGRPMLGGIGGGANAGRMSPALHSPSLGSGAGGGSVATPTALSRPTSPGGTSGGVGGPGGSPPVKQSEILQSFFQSLLNKDKPTGGAPPGGLGAGGGSSSPPSASSTAAATAAFLASRGAQGSSRGGGAGGTAQRGAGGSGD